MFKIIKDLNLILSKKQKIYLSLIYFGAFIVSIFEIVSIGSLVGFITMLSNPEFIIEKIPFKSFKIFLLDLDKLTIAIYSSIALLIIFTFKNLFFLFFYYAESQINKNLTVDFSKNVFRSYLEKPYIFHTINNSSSSISTIQAIVQRAMSYIFSNLILFREMLTIMMLMCSLIFFNPKISIITFSLLILVSLMFYLFFKKKIKQLGSRTNNLEKKTMKYLMEAFSYIKLIKLFNTNAFWIKKFFIHKNRLHSYQAISYMVGRIPKILLELLSVVAIIVIFLSFIYDGKQIEDVLPILTLIVLVVIRSLPGFININSSINNINFNHEAIVQILSILNNERNSNEYTDKRKLIESKNKKEAKSLDKIELKNISFSYNQNKKIIDNISLKIKKGEIIGISGKTGSGKTTLIDIILGLLKPIEGKIFINDNEIDEKYLSNIKVGYVPQDTYLSDDSIRDNIAFSLNENDIDQKKVEKAIIDSNLSEFINELPNKENTLVGEGGVRLSGGQKQRLGIARALYNDPELIILDEATSSLDYETEKNIITEILNLKENKIIIMIAHRINTLENCDKIINLSEGKIS